MAVFKCKMCGGDLNIIDRKSICECEYCGSKQTIPISDSEKLVNLYNRANRLRLSCEFDKASGIYESIVSEFPEEAEAYWGLCLCKFGIEYVDDPTTATKIPTCHRTSYNSITNDEDYKCALKYADTLAEKEYRDEAKVIEELRISIIEVSFKEEPYDIFICYKEKDSSGERTVDSVMAQDVYNALTQNGYRVFFSRISLEDKIGQEYEPYIFAALNSAKVMLVFGTDYDNFNAVWVKNEWSRFLALIESGEKKTLIPCYKDMDAYDMPNEFKKLQAQDMGKIGALQDLLRGIDKVIDRNNETAHLHAQEPGKKLVQPSLITNVSSIGSNDKGDIWPSGNYSSVIDIDTFRVINFHISTHPTALANKREIKITLRIYNSDGLMVSDIAHDITWAANYTRASVNWVLRGDDGYFVPLGKYLAEISIDDCQPFKLNFIVVSADGMDEKEMKQILRTAPKQNDPSIYTLRPTVQDDSKAAGILIIISMIIPLVGLIMGGVCIAQGEKRAGKAYLITSIVVLGLTVAMSVAGIIFRNVYR